MSNPVFQLSLEIPSDVPQQELWELNDHVSQIEGVTTDLQEAKNLLADAFIFVQIIATTIAPIGVIAESAKSVYEVAKLIYEFVHSKEKAYDVTINKNGKKIKIKEMSLEDIEKIIKDI